MLKIYGSTLCPDCLVCKEDLDRAGVSYKYLDFSDSLLHLKEFLLIRDTSPVFDEVRQAGKLGIPCIVKDDGSVTLTWSEFM